MTVKQIRLVKDWNNVPKGTEFAVLQPGEDLVDETGARRVAVDARRAAVLIEGKLAIEVVEAPERASEDAGDGGDGGDSEGDSSETDEKPARGRRSRRSKE